MLATFLLELNCPKTLVVPLTWNQQRESCVLFPKQGTNMHKVNTYGISDTIVRQVASTERLEAAMACAKLKQPGLNVSQATGFGMYT